MRGTDVGSGKVKPKLKQITKPTSTRIKNDTNNLQNEPVRKASSLELCYEFAVLEMLSFTPFNKAFHNTAVEILGKKKKSNKPWISQGSWSMIEEGKDLKVQAKVEKSVGL